MEVAKKRRAQLGRIKKLVKKTHDYFNDNCKRYNRFRRFVFERSLSEDDRSLLATLGKPQLEFNVLEAYISRLLGEFSKQEPSVIVMPSSPQAVDPKMIDLVELHLRHAISSPIAERTKYEIYKAMLSGGFSVGKVFTEYASPMSFDQEIRFTNVSDPTLCGFDPMAREPHKGDGDFCFEIFPMERERFEGEYPDIRLDKINFTRSMAGFNWSYTNNGIEYLLVCDWYEKKKLEVTIVQLRDGRVMERDEYQKMVDEWQEMTVPPAILGKPRKTDRETIVRYRLIDNQVISYEETDYSMLPLVFFDGNSVMIANADSNNVRQVTRPYVYHALGAQRLKNFAGISLANEIENTIQHKFMVAKEALPKEGDALAAYEDVQKASVLIFNAFDEQNPDKQIPMPIREVQRNPAPPEILQAFTGTDSLIQNVLGSYDASLGINNNQLSGVAVVEAATQSNAAAMPFLVGFMQGLQRVAQVMVSLFPKYYTTPRTIPVQDEEGKRGYVMLNSPGTMKMEYDPYALNVVVDIGPSFRVQQSKTIQQIVALQQASPMFAQFMAERGLPYLLSNVEMLGIERLKEEAEEWMAEQAKLKQQQQQELQQKAMAMNPAMQKVEVEKQKVAQDAQKNAMQFQVDMAKLKQDESKVLSDLQLEREKGAVQMVKASTERFAKQVELAVKGHDQHLKAADMAHRHSREAREPMEAGEEGRMVQ